MQLKYELIGHFSVYVFLGPPGAGVRSIRYFSIYANTPPRVQSAVLVCMAIVAQAVLAQE